MVLSPLTCARGVSPPEYYCLMRPIEESIGPIRTVADDIGPTVLSLVPFCVEQHTRSIPNDSLVRCAHKKNAKNKLASFIHHLYTGGGLEWPEEPTVKLNGMNLRLISSLKVHGVPVPRAYIYIYIYMSRLGRHKPA